MRKKTVFITLLIITFVALLLVYVSYKDRSFNVNIAVANNTNVDKELNLSLIMGEEVTSSREET